MKKSVVSNLEPEEKNTQEKTTSLWTQRGEEDIAYQRQAQVTWWTLLGGIAVAALLTQFEALLAAIKNGQWYYLLYFFATCLVIINAWIQTVWGALVLYWPISVLTSIFLFMQGLCESLAALNITRPILWTISIAGVLLFAVLMQLTFMKLDAWVTLPKTAIKKALVGIWVYSMIFVIAVGVSITLYFFPSQQTELIWGVIACVIACFALYWQHLGMKEEKKRMRIA
jgi:hypothetical protein